MAPQSPRRVRRESWATAGFFLIVFCWLGFATTKFAVVYEGLEARLPFATRFVEAHGGVAFPLLGIIAAATLILSSAYLARWMQWVWIMLFALLVYWGFTLLFADVGGLGPAFKTDQAHAVDGRTAPLFQIACHWPAASDAQRYASA
jgi:hypothetical protein